MGTFFRDLMALLDADMTTPTMYGWFHLMCLGVLFAALILTLIFFRKPSQKVTHRVLLICGIIMLLFEIYKQLNFSYDVVSASWHYQWYAFPFQFCSTPMYIMLLAGIIKKGKLYNHLTAYLATYALLGGLLVMFYPSTVFVDTIGINIQTMVHHGLQVYVGLFLLLRGSVSNKLLTLRRAFIVFATLLATALLLNYLVPLAGVTDTFNMFFISPKYDCGLPVLNSIQQNVPYVVFLLIYAVAFTLGAWLMLLGDKLVCMLRKKTTGK